MLCCLSWPWIYICLTQCSYFTRSIVFHESVKINIKIKYKVSSKGATNQMLGLTCPVLPCYRCGCPDCIKTSKEDSLRHSRSRINSYRALSSPSLIALTSTDPILTGFQLSLELKNLAYTENEFRAEYLVIIFFFFTCPNEQSMFPREVNVPLQFPGLMIPLSYSSTHPLINHTFLSPPINPSPFFPTHRNCGVRWWNSQRSCWATLARPQNWRWCSTTTPTPSALTATASTWH